MQKLPCLALVDRCQGVEGIDAEEGAFTGASHPPTHHTSHRDLENLLGVIGWTSYCSSASPIRDVSSDSTMMTMMVNDQKISRTLEPETRQTEKKVGSDSQQPLGTVVSASHWISGGYGTPPRRSGSTQVSPTPPQPPGAPAGCRCFSRKQWRKLLSREAASRLVVFERTLTNTQHGAWILLSFRVVSRTPRHLADIEGLESAYLERVAS